MAMRAGARGKQPAQQEEVGQDGKDEGGGYDDRGAGPAAGQVSERHDDGDEGGHVSDSHDSDFEDYVRRPTLKKQKKAAKKTIVQETQDSCYNADGFDDRLSSVSGRRYDVSHGD
eukprot:271422-Rhodomonas_salina.1